METIFQPCGNGDNVCKCKSASECGYDAKTNSDSLTWEEAKNEVAKKYVSVNFHYLEPFITEAAELYASSRVRALEEENKRLKEELQSWKDEHAQIVDDYGSVLREKDEKIERLKQRLEAADGICRQYKLGDMDQVELCINHYNFLKP